jgi:hypothetical protein
MDNFVRNYTSNCFVVLAFAMQKAWQWLMNKDFTFMILNFRINKFYLLGIWFSVLVLITNAVFLSTLVALSS